MINIKNIDGSLLYAAPVTKDAVFHHELMSSEYIELVFNEVTVIDIPIGAYVEYNGSRYTVTNPVTPDIIDGGYKYCIQFKADWMRWEGITYFYINEFSQKNETSWSMTATPDLFLQMIVENISRATGKTYTFSYDSSLTATKDLQFNNTTVLEALSMVADAFETEWWIEGTVIHLSRCEHGDALALTYGQNIGVPSVQRSSEYATRIYAFGSTRNITQDYQNSGATNALVEKRLTLPAGKYPNGYKDIKPNLSPEEIIEKTVIFDDIYPSSDFAISDVRVKVSVDSTTEVGKDENGNPIYASMPVYFFKIAGIAFSEDLIIEGLTLKVHFLTGHLQGREFELAYHKDTSEYEIIVNQDGAIKLPNETLLPQDNDVVVLFNIVMPDEYVTSAENRLEAALDDYIEKKLLSDNNTYSFKSNPVTFAENNTSVNVGRKITLNHGTGILQSRILSIEYPLEYPSKVDISVGESIPQGKISSVETEVVNASSTIEIIQAYNNVAQTVQNLYARTQNQITEGLAKLANMWILDQSKDTTPNKTNPDVWFVRSPYDVVGLKGISAYGLGSTSGGSASGSLGELVNVGQWADAVPTADRVMVQLAGATHWSAKPLADLVGLDTAALAQYLTANSYLKASDISSYLTWANLSGKPTVYPTNWANIADKPTVYPTTWTSVTGRPTKLSQFTDDVVAGNYLPKPTWDAVFEVVTVDGTPALKVKYDILGLKGITAYADGTLSGGFSGALVDLVDVAVTNLASGDILKYNGTHFVNVPVSSIAGASSWDQITGKPEYYPTRWADVFGAPASLPASDVYPWAKAASKPTYTAAEVGALALSGGTLTGNVITIGSFILANSGAYPQLTFRATADNSERLLFRHGNDLKWRYNGTNDGIIYHSGNFNPGNYLLLSGGTMTGDITFGSNGRSLRGSDGGNIAGVLYDTPNARYVTAIGTGSRRLILVSPASIYRGAGGVAENYMIYDSGNFNPSSKLDKSVWDEAFELKTVNGVRVISAKLDFLSVAGISAYATGPSSGGGGGGLDYDLLKQALTGAITPDGYPFTISASFLGAIGNTYLPLSGGTLTNTGNSAPLIITGSSLQACTKYMMNGSTVSGYFGVVAQGLNGAFMQYANGTISPSLIINNDAAPRFINTAGTQFILYHSGNFNPDSKFPYLGMGGVNDNSNEIGAGYSGSSAGGNFNGPFIKFGQTSNYMTELYNRHDQDVFQIRRMVNGEWQAFVNLWHSGNFNPDNYLPLTGNKTITGSLTVANGFTSGIMKCQTGAYPQLQFEQTNTGVTSILFVHTNNALIYRPVDPGSDYTVYHSGNFNPDNYLLKTANAVSASKWATARTLTLTGSASGNVSMDGSANVSLSVTNNRLNSNSEMTYGWNGINYFNLAGTAGAAAKINDTPTTAWWHILRFNHGNSAGYYTDLAVPFNDNTLYYKRVTSGTLHNGGWVKIWDEKNANLSTVDWAAKNITAAGTVTAPTFVGDLSGSADKLFARYTGSGGQQGPGYFGKERFGCLMMNTPVNGNSHYKNWLICDAYSGSDAGGATAIGVDRHDMRVFAMSSDANRTSWNRSCELYTTVNANLSTVNWTANTLTATKLVLGGITIDVYNGALRVNGNLVATGGVTAYQ
jgi:hypothetical protein|nr:MAG TPA: tail protein [Caudoviricetes sp.]